MHPYLRILLVFLAFLALPGASAAAPKKRLAFVIGNASHV
jgi:hypothetical protein